MNIEDEKQTLARLEAKLAEVTARATELQTERRRISFAAMTDDAAARKALNAANAASATHDLEIENVRSAIQEAGRRLAEAERAEEMARLAGNAERALAVGEQLAERGRRMDELAGALFGEAKAMSSDLSELHSLGCSHPNHFQLQSLGERALKSIAMDSPLKIEHLAPRERRSFSEMTSGFAAAVSHWASAFLEKSEAA